MIVAENWYIKCHLFISYPLDLFYAWVIRNDHRTKPWLISASENNRCYHTGFAYKERFLRSKRVIKLGLAFLCLHSRLWSIILSIMNSLMLVLQGIILVSSILHSVEGYTPYIKPHGDTSSISERRIKVKISYAYRFWSKFKQWLIIIVGVQRHGGNWGFCCEVRK